MALSILKRAHKSRRECPMTTKVIYEVGISYTEFVRVNEQEQKMSNLMTFFICTASEKPMNPIPAALLATQPAATDEPVEVIFSTQVLELTQEAARRWYVELVGCEQVKPLVEGNYTNYFRMAKSTVEPWRIEDVVKFYAAAEDRFVSDPYFRKFIRESDFVRYHTSATSASSLVFKAITASPFGQIFTAEQMAYVLAAHAQIDRLDLAKRIPYFVILMTQLILDAADALPPVWHMGRKAMEAYPPTKYSALRKVVKKAIALLTNSDAIDGATNVAELKVMFLDIIAKDEDDIGGGAEVPDPPDDEPSDSDSDSGSESDGPGGGGGGGGRGGGAGDGKGPEPEEDVFEGEEDPYRRVDPQSYGQERRGSAQPYSRTYGSGFSGTRAGPPQMSQATFLALQTEGERYRAQMEEIARQDANTRAMYAAESQRLGSTAQGMMPRSPVGPSVVQNVFPLGSPGDYTGFTTANLGPPAAQTGPSIQLSQHAPAPVQTGGGPGAGRGRNTGRGNQAGRGRGAVGEGNQPSGSRSRTSSGTGADVHTNPSASAGAEGGGADEL